MKLNIVKGFLVLFISIYTSFSFSQNNFRENVISSPEIQHNGSLSESNKSTNSNQEKKKSVKYPMTVSKKAGEEQVIHDEEYLKKEIVRIENHIKAIEFKVQNVSSDPSSRAKAEKDGWFDQMSKIKIALQEKKIKLEEELKSFNNK